MTSQSYWRGFVEHQRALVLASLIEGVAVVLLAISSWLDWPFWFSLAPVALHFPAMYAIEMLRFPFELNYWVAMALLQWLFWLVVLNMAFFIADRFRNNSGHRR
jgi:hypothetical protein